MTPPVSGSLNRPLVTPHRRDYPGITTQEVLPSNYYPSVQ